jgi:ketosteroid isomerase-like protein
MGGSGERGRAGRPEDLGRLFVERANDGDLEGLVELYEPAAVLAFPPGQVIAGHEAIREAYRKLLAEVPAFAGEPQPALRNGDWALTSTRLPGGRATAEVAHRQPDGSWRWLIDQPRIVA